MNTKLDYHPEARSEFVEIIAYLREQGSNLAGDFIDEIVATENQLVEYPRSAQLVMAGIHKRPLRRFRYSIIYSSESGYETITVLAIAHQSRADHYWKDRV